MPELKDEHYLRSVTELGDTRRIIANCDIHSQSGIKLVAAGFHITTRLYERLVNHMLLPPLDKALSIENMLDSESILKDLHDLIRTNSKLARMSGCIGNSLFDRQILAIRLPSPLAFKLTVAREKYHHIYQHSLALLVTCVYLAHCNGMDTHEQEWVAIAALFHDIGLLHVDPKLLVSSHVMSDAERRHLYTHPLTAYLLLREFPELSGEIADAVLEHHEHMDGSGYPRGLHSNKISRYGQILAVAEVSAKAFDSNQPTLSWKKLEMMLKLNSKKYGQGFIKDLNILREKNTANASADIDSREHLVVQVKLISMLFEDFNGYSELMRHDKTFNLAKTRLTALQRELSEAGFNPGDPISLIRNFTDDPGCMFEYVPLLNETLWQFKALVLEISRRDQEEMKEKYQIKKQKSVWLDDMEQRLASFYLSSAH